MCRRVDRRHVAAVACRNSGQPDEVPKRKQCVAHGCHIGTGTGLAPATSAPGLDWSHPCLSALPLCRALHAARSMPAPRGLHIVYGVVWLHTVLSGVHVICHLSGVTTAAAETKAALATDGPHWLPMGRTRATIGRLCCAIAGMCASLPRAQEDRHMARARPCIYTCIHTYVHTNVHAYMTRGTCCARAHTQTHTAHVARARAYSTRGTHERLLWSRTTYRRDHAGAVHAAQAGQVSRCCMLFGTIVDCS